MEPSMAGAPNSPTYLSLWDDFLTNILVPEFRRVYLQLHDEPRHHLSRQLLHYRHDPQLYPFIHDRVREFMEDICRKFLLHASRNWSKYASVDKISHFWARFTTLDTQIVIQALAPLESAFLKVAENPPTHPKMMAKEVFRRCAYSNFAARLRDEALKAISDDFKVIDSLALTPYLRLIREVGEDDVAFFGEEWDKPLFKRLFKNMKKSISEWGGRPLREFLEKVATLICECRKMFVLFSGDIEKAIMKEIETARDLILFQNDPEQFKELIVKPGNSETLKLLFDQFHKDQQFLRTIAARASGLYSDMIYGKAGRANTELFEKEKTFKNLLALWFRVHSVLGQRNVKRKAVQAALVDPLLDFTNLATQYPRTISNVLTECFNELVSKSPYHDDEMKQSSMEKLTALSSLSKFLPPTNIFPEAFRLFLSRKLLQISSESINGHMLSALNSIIDHNDGSQETSLMLKDACNWGLYQSEMYPITKEFLERRIGTDIDLRMVRRSLWDLESDVHLVFPADLRPFVRNVIDNFHSRYPMRCASIHSMAGQMIIRSKLWSYNGSDVRLTLSTAQGCVLARFRHGEISLRDLAREVLVNHNEALGLPVLVAILKSLIAEHPILKKKPENAEFCETDTFCLNKQFRPMSELIALPYPKYPGEIYDGDATTTVTHMLAIDQVLVVRAAIMKLLKGERELEMSQVKSIVMERLRTRFDLSQFNFDEVVTKLEEDEYVSVDKDVIRYIP